MKLHYIPLFLLAACTADDDALMPAPTQGPQPERAEAPVVLEIASAWGIDTNDTRVPPPGVSTGGTGSGETISDDNGWHETANVDKIRVIAFRRKEKLQTSDGRGGYADNMTDFVYDPENDTTVTVASSPVVDPDDNYHTIHQHRRATSVLHKTYGYEYRIIAIAYSGARQLDYANISSFSASNSVWHSGTGEQHAFTLNTGDGLTLANFAATFREQIITDNHDDTWSEYLCGRSSLTLHTHCITGGTEENAPINFVPQLFYGQCTLDTLGTGVTLQDPAALTSPVIRFSEQGTDSRYHKDLPISGTLLRGMAEVQIVIPNVKKLENTTAHHNPNWIALLADQVRGSVGLDSYDRFNPTLTTGNTNRYHAVAASTVETGSRAVITAYLLPCPTRFAFRVKTDGTARYSIFNFPIRVADAVSTGSATGVISPDASNNTFYLRRNHKYVITINNFVSATAENREID